MVRTLWSTWVAFSAIQRAPWSGNSVFISAGASVPGVFWNSMRMPSMTRVSPVVVIVSVGAISETVPVEVVWPRPVPIWPAGPRSSAAPNM